jgi:FkbM family methyltransferase
MSSEFGFDPLRRPPETAHFREIIKQLNFDYDSVRCVMDLGSRDAIEACDLAELFPNARVIAVEANPPAVDMCHQTVQKRGMSSRVEVVGVAINDFDGRCEFQAIDPAKTTTPWIDGNIGASSLFKANGSYEHETYVQETIEVPCIRLDSLLRTLNAPSPDVLWCDLQGGELLAFRSIGDKLRDVRLIHTEVSHKAAYSGQAMWGDVRDLLHGAGFELAAPVDMNGWQTDAVFVNAR